MSARTRGAGPRSRAAERRREGAPRPSRQTPRWWAHPAAWSALAALLLYLPSLRFGFVWDDHQLIEANPAIHAGGNLARLVLSDFWAPTGVSSGYWRPLVVLSYWLDGALSHWSTAWFHAVNLLSHAAVSAAVAALILDSGAPGERGGSAVGALAGGLWFAVMPAHVESVAWIAGRTDVLCALFFVPALWLDRRARARGATWPGVGPLILFALALLCKETAIALLPLLVVAEIARRGEPGADRRWSWLLAYVVIAAAWAGVHWGLAAHRPWAMAVDPVQRLRTRWVAAATFLRSLPFLWPWVSHAPGVTLRLPERALAPEVVGGALVHLAWLGGIVWLARRRSPLAAPLALFWLALLPLAAVALLQGNVLFAERFLYLPSVGAAWAGGLALTAALRWPGAASFAGGVALLVVGGSAAQSWRLIPRWRDDTSLFTWMADARPRNVMAHTNRGIQLFSQGRDREALAEFAVAQELNPRVPEIYFGRALVHFSHGEWTEAVSSADSAAALDSTRIEPRVLRSEALMRLGRGADAAAEIRRLMAQAPGNPMVESAWGQYLLARSRPAEALPFLERASRFLHRDADLEYGLGLAYVAAKRTAEARAAFARAVEADPAFYDGWLDLATACHLLGDPAARDLALARAAALPEARDGRVETLRRRLAGGAP